MTGYYIGAAALIALLATLAWVYAKGRRSAKTETALEAAEQYAKTRKDMDNAEDDVGSDPAIARRWLREHGQR